MPVEGHYEELGGGVRLWVTPAHKFGADAFLLSDFAAPRAGDRAADLGSGCGIVPALWFCRPESAPREAVAVELQEAACAQMERSLAEGNLPAGRFVPLCADLRELRGRLPAGGFDLVTCNPPYTGPGGGLLSADPAGRIARHETACTLADVSAAAGYQLRYGGRFCLCHRPERLADVVCALREAGLEPKRLRLVQQRPERAPWLLLLEGRRGGKPGLRVDPPLIVEGEGGLSPEMLRIYRKNENKKEGGR